MADTSGIGASGEGARIGLREAKKRQLKRKLFGCAVELFEQRGFEATRIRDITERAQVSHATFFNYFAGRDGLASEWIHEQLDQVFEQSATAAQSGPLRPSLRRGLRHWSSWLEQRSDWLVEIWPRGRYVSGEAFPGARRLVAEAQGRGEFRRDLPPEQLGPLLGSVAQGAVAGWLARAVRDERLDRYLLRAVDLVLDGARRRNERVQPAKR